MNDLSKRFKVDCEVIVTEDDVWQYLDGQGEDADELREQGYEFSLSDWVNTAQEMFEADDFTYFDFVEVR